MDKKEFLELRDKLQQFEEEHSRELLIPNTLQALYVMISVTTDYINHYTEEN